MLLSDSNARGRAERLATLEDGDSNTLNCTVDNDNALSEGHSAGLPGALDTTSEEWFVERCTFSANCKYVIIFHQFS
jgi:hypothetical protein